MADYSSMLMQLRTELANTQIKERQLTEAIHNLERLTGQGESKPDPNNPTPFKEATYGDAARDVITSQGPQTTRDLAEALLRGGAQTKSRNFVATLYSLLYKDGRFRLGDDKKWVLKAPSAGAHKKRA